MDVPFVLDTMRTMFPNAQCELMHKNDFELLIAVVLSAQTTDQAVNKITPKLFEEFPTPNALGNGNIKAIEHCIHRIGLYRNKAANIKVCAQMIEKQFGGHVPSSFKDLMSLPGVGRKTASVVRSVWFAIPSMPVDTHVERIAKRLGFAKFGDSIEVVEQKLKRKIQRKDWNEAHHLLIFFGRYHCMARNPKCEECTFVGFCKNKKFERYKTLQKE